MKMVWAYIAAGAGLAYGIASERYGLPAPNFRDVANIAGGNTNVGLEANAFERAKEVVVEAEGNRNDVYKDSRGILTVGIGHKVTAIDQLKEGQTISDQRVAQLFASDIHSAFDAALSQAKQLEIYTVEMIAALTSVNFQLGIYWRVKFPNTWAALKTGDYITAIKNLKKSAWAQQTPERVEAFVQTIQQEYA